MRQLCSAAAKAPGGFQELWSWSLPKLHKEFAWPASVLSSLERYRASLGLQPCIEVPVEVLLPCDPEWPAGFARLERPPLSIQWRGRRGLLSSLSLQQAVAVVGTRRPSNHGLRMADNLGRVLAQAHWPVVSGLAERALMQLLIVLVFRLAALPSRCSELRCIVFIRLSIVFCSWRSRRLAC